MLRPPQPALLASGAILLACSPTPDTREASTLRDAAVSTSSESKVAALPPCMWELEACADHIDWRFKPLLRASELGPDAHFLAIGGQTVGVATGASAGSPSQLSVVRLYMDDEPEPYRRIYITIDVEG